MKGNPIVRRDPCGCIIRSNDVEYCPGHKPAWIVGAEVLIDQIEKRQLPLFDQRRYQERRD